MASLRVLEPVACLKPSRLLSNHVGHSAPDLRPIQEPQPFRDIASLISVKIQTQIICTSRSQLQSADVCSTGSAAKFESSEVFAPLPKQPHQTSNNDLRDMHSSSFTAIQNTADHPETGTRYGLSGPLPNWANNTLQHCKMLNWRVLHDIRFSFLGDRGHDATEASGGHLTYRSRLIVVWERCDASE